MVEYGKTSAYTHDGFTVDYCLAKRGYYHKDDSLSVAEYRKAEKESLFTGEEDDFLSFADKCFYMESGRESDVVSSKSFGVPLNSVKGAREEPVIRSLDQSKYLNNP